MVSVKDYNLKYRPVDYFDELSVLTNIKGQYRRMVIRQLISKGEAETIPNEYFSQSLPEAMIKQLEEKSSRMASGEYLPDYLPGECELARIIYDTIGLEIISIRVRKDGHKFLYRVVDERDTQFTCRPKSSRKPLTLKRLIKLINNIKAPKDSYFSTRLKGGDIQIILNPGGTAEIAHRFEVESEFYPTLGRWYYDKLEKIKDRNKNKGIYAGCSESDNKNCFSEGV